MIVGPETVYALSDPRNPKLPRYIGKTRDTLRRRLINHRCYAKSHPTIPLGIWINELASLSLVPIIYALETVVDGAKEREVYWIRFFRPLGTLTNRSDGDGSLGLKNGPPSKLNQSITAPILKACNEKRRMPIVAVETGQTFESVSSAARAIGYDKGHFAARIKSGKPIRGIHWKFLT